MFSGQICRWQNRFTRAWSRKEVVPNDLGQEIPRYPGSRNPCFDHFRRIGTRRDVRQCHWNRGRHVQGGGSIVSSCSEVDIEISGVNKENRDCELFDRSFITAGWNQKFKKKLNNNNTSPTSWIPYHQFLKGLWCNFSFFLLGKLAMLYYYIINTIFLASICTFVPPNLALQFSKKNNQKKKVQVIETFTPLQPWSLLESPNSPGMFV